MGHYVRVLSTSSQCVPFSVLQKALDTAKLRAKLVVSAGTSDAWEELVLSHEDGREIASIERNAAEEGELGAEELADFADEVREGKPASGARWLIDFFPRVKCIYALQVLSGTNQKNGWEIFGEVKGALWSAAPAIIQSDSEGFSNEDGYHILWQFSDSVEGSWWMGVLQDGAWKHFQMDLGNQKHRDAFFRGEIPEGAKLA